MNFFNKLEYNFFQYRDHVALIDSANDEKLSYKNLNIESGKVYGYLKNKGISKEDIVLICLPRGIVSLIVCIGVWKTAAAVSIFEDDYPSEKLDSIKNDPCIKFVIDKSNINEIFNSEFLEGRENYDSHNLAYLVYTSGTTGKPKCVMHEFGTFDYCIKGSYYNGNQIYNQDDKVALISPFSFAATIIILVSTLYFGGTLVLFPASLISMPNKMISIFEKYKVNLAFMTPTFVRAFKKLPACLEKLILSAEPVNNIEIMDIEVYNRYLQSESGFAILCNKIDDCNIDISAGKPLFSEAEVSIRDEYGNPSNEGEITYKNQYFRGYLGQKDITKQTIVNGYIKSGDMGKKLDDGSILIVGRIDDMVNINGNRVEPAEIEHAVSQVFDLEWCGVKIVNNNGKYIICAYYLEDVNINIDDANKMLKDSLAAYMHPNYYCKIGKIPRNSNDKFDRNLLPDPDISLICNGYVPPKTNEEKLLCEEMAKALHMDIIGMNDDFFKLGADSIASLELLINLDWENFDYEILCEGRTPKKIMEILSKKIIFCKG